MQGKSQLCRRDLWHFIIEICGILPERFVVGFITKKCLKTKERPPLDGLLMTPNPTLRPALYNLYTPTNILTLFGSFRSFSSKAFAKISSGQTNSAFPKTISSIGQ